MKSSAQRARWILKGKEPATAFPRWNNWTTCLLIRWKKETVHYMSWYFSHRVFLRVERALCLGMPWLSWSKHMAGSCVRPYVKSSQIWAAGFFFPPHTSFHKNSFFPFLDIGKLTPEKGAWASECCVAEQFIWWVNWPSVCVAPQDVWGTRSKLHHRVTSML